MFFKTIITFSHNLNVIEMSLKRGTMLKVSYPDDCPNYQD